MPKPIKPAPRKAPIPLKAPTPDQAAAVADAAERHGMTPELIAELPEFLVRHQLPCPLSAPLVHRATLLYRERAEAWWLKWLESNETSRIKVIVDGDLRFDRWRN